MNGIIYKITNPFNDKIYIGQSTKSLSARRSTYKNDAKTRNYGIYAALNKYGFNNFKFEIIEVCPIRQLDKQERYWIKLYNSLITQNGYNIESGGHKNKKHHPITRQKISQNHPSKKPGFIHPNKNRIFSEEWKQNMRKPKNLTKKQRNKIRKRLSKLHKGKSFTDEHKLAIAQSKFKKVDQYDKEGMFLKTWPSIQEICEVYKTSATNISEVLHNKQKTAKGFIWKIHNTNV